jgi:hypothetical protein
MTTNFPNESIHWTPNGTRVSGNGYGFSLYRDAIGSRFAVKLTLGSEFVDMRFPTLGALVPCGTFNDAYNLGSRFCHAMHMWNVAQNRNRALANGVGVLGGVR